MEKRAAESLEKNFGKFIYVILKSDNRGIFAIYHVLYDCWQIMTGLSSEEKDKIWMIT